MKAILVLSLTFLVGCASVDYDFPRSENALIPAGNSTPLDLRAAELVVGKDPNHSGFLLLEDGIDALAARIRLAEEAERTIDVQYYLVKRDKVGLAFLGSLLAAADRGVRVRLLIDDMYNGGFDTGMTALDSHPNFEIRVFNPFNRGLLGKPLGGAANFPRINRRMHNKSFTTDSQFTVIGGRNIADEYFGAREDAAFGDLDVVAVGPVVNDVDVMFEQYWTHRAAIPVGGFIPPTASATEALTSFRQQLERVARWRRTMMMNRIVGTMLMLE